MRPYYIIFSLSLVLTPFAYAQVIDKIATTSVELPIEIVDKTPYIFKNDADLPIYLEVNNINPKYEENVQRQLVLDAQ